MTREERRLLDTVKRLDQAYETGNKEEYERLTKVAAVQRTAWIRAVKSLPVSRTRFLAKLERELANPRTTMARKLQLGPAIQLARARLSASITDAAEISND